MKIAVTGSSGFIGSHMISALIMNKHDVTSMIDSADVQGSDSQIRYKADITVGEGLEKAFRDADGVIHLAALSHLTKGKTKNPLARYRKINVEGTQNVIRAAVRAGARWFIHFSSIKAMGESSADVLDEESPCMPKTPYGISKLESEEVVQSEARRSGMRAVIVRLPMAYGPRNRGNFPRMIRWADWGLPFPLFQPDNLRSMIYVGNVVAGVLAMLNGAPKQVSKYILKDSEDYSTRKIFSAICRELGKPQRFFSIPSTVVRLGGVLSEDFRKVTESFRVSSEKIGKELGFYPPFSLEEGVARTIDWYKRSVPSRSA